MDKYIGAVVGVFSIFRHPGHQLFESKHYLGSLEKYKNIYP